MANKKANLITHPVRSRILAALMGRQLTTGQLSHLLPDVPLPTLYYQVRRLWEGGLLEVAGELRVNGAPTRLYAVNREEARLTPQDLPEDGRAAAELQGLSAFLNTLAGHFRAQLLTGTYVPGRDPLHAYMEPLYLSPEDYPAFVDGLRGYLRPWQEAAPEGERRRVLFAHIALPDSADPPLT